MAKTSRQVKSFIYNSGVCHSFCVHVILLLILALVYSNSYDLVPKPIKIEFTTTPEDKIEHIVFEEIQVVEDTTDHETTEFLDIIDESLDNNIQIDLSKIELASVEPPKDILSDHIDELSDQIIQSSFIQETTDNLGELKRRLKKYGAKTGDIQISLSWDTKDDLDLHVIVRPYMSHICWYSKLDGYGGELDIDMNADEDQLSDEPIENIYWLKTNKHRKNSKYTVSVNFYRQWTMNKSVKAIVAIKTGSHTETKHITVSLNNPTVEVFSFNR